VSERCDGAALAAVYGSGAQEYDTLWSPVILPPAQAMIAALELRDAGVILDVGGGTGALTTTLSAAAPRALIAVMDPSWDMLRYAVILAYVLFHLTTPSSGLVEAARVLRAGGLVGTVTWAREWGSHAAQVWDQTFQDLDVPDLPAHGNHTGLDTSDAMQALLADAGFDNVRAWYEDISYTFEADQFFELRAHHGRSRARLALLDETRRAKVLDDLRARLPKASPADYKTRGRLVCAVGTRAS
jgi:SAM-dependent methyltransferase